MLLVEFIEGMVKNNGRCMFYRTVTRECKREVIYDGEVKNLYTEEKVGSGCTFFSVKVDSPPAACSVDNCPFLKPKGKRVDLTVD